MNDVCAQEGITISDNITNLICLYFVDNDQIVEDRPEIEITTYSELFLSLVEESITTQSL